MALVTPVHHAGLTLGSLRESRLSAIGKINLDWFRSKPTDLDNLRLCIENRDTSYPEFGTKIDLGLQSHQVIGLWKLLDSHCGRNHLSSEERFAELKTSARRCSFKSQSFSQELASVTLPQSMIWIIDYRMLDYKNRRPGSKAPWIRLDIDFRFWSILRSG